MQSFLPILGQRSDVKRQLVGSNDLRQQTARMLQARPYVTSAGQKMIRGHAVARGCRQQSLVMIEDVTDVGISPNLSLNGFSFLLIQTGYHTPPFTTTEVLQKLA